MAAFFRRAFSAVRPSLFGSPRTTRVPKNAPSRDIHAAVSIGMQHTFQQDEMHASCWKTYFYVGATASVLAWQTYSMFAHPALCMTRELEPPPVVHPPPGVVSWDLAMPGSSKPTGDHLTFVKAHYWKLENSEVLGKSQLNKGGNFRVVCKQCGKGPVVWPTTRLKAHVAGKLPVKP